MLTSADIELLLRQHRHLETLISSHNWWLGVFTAVVAFGIFVEILVEYFFGREKSKWEITAILFAGAIVLGGVIGEYIEGGWVANDAGKLQKLADNDVARLFERAAIAEQHAEEARRDTEKERIARLKLEAQVAPRNLTKPQLDTLARLWHKHVGKEIVLSWNDGDESKFRLAIRRCNQSSRIKAHVSYCTFFWAYGTRRICERFLV
jgi:hypothetical protein